MAVKVPTGVAMLLFAAQILEGSADASLTNGESDDASSIATSTTLCSVATSATPCSDVPEDEPFMGYRTRSRVSRKTCGSSPTSTQLPPPARKTDVSTRKSKASPKSSVCGNADMSSKATKKKKKAAEKERMHCRHPGCPKTVYGRIHDLVRHEKTHLPPELRPYRCDWPHCAFTTVQKSNLETHLDTHNGKTIGCEEYKDGEPCQYRCSNPGQMTRHKQSAHAGLPRSPARSNSTSSSNASEDGMWDGDSPLSTPPDSPVIWPADPPSMDPSGSKGLFDSRGYVPDLHMSYPPLVDPRYRSDYFNADGYAFPMPEADDAEQSESRTFYMPSEA